MSKPFKPQVATANDLLEGDVVYLTEAGGWTRDHAEAAVARDKETAEALLALGAAQAGAVVGVYLAEAALDDDGRPQPVHYRERLRALGPSTRPDLGPQAGRTR